MEYKPRHETYQLDNGLVVVLEKTPTVTISSQLTVNFGTANEQLGEEGLAHFLEHCLCTGGSRLYTPSDADDVRASFGYSNAFTNIDKTTFVANLLPEDIKNWIKFISDHMFNPKFDSKRVDQERERVIREISDKKSNPDYARDLEFRKLFYRNHPVTLNVLGESGVINSVTVEGVSQFHSRGYSPNNMELILVGALPEDISQLVRECFGEAQPGGSTRIDFPFQVPLIGKHKLTYAAPERINQDNPNESSAYVSVVSSAPLERTDDSYTFSLLSRILGRGMDSNLFQRLSLERGLAYSLQTSYFAGNNVAAIDTEVNADARRIDEVIEGIFTEYDRVKQERLNPERLERVGKRIRFEIASAMESNRGRLNYLDGLLDSDPSIERIFEILESITPDSVQSVAQKYLPSRDGNYVVVVHDPLAKSNMQSPTQ
jgi:predicted Zn-dependent peptidase